LFSKIVVKWLNLKVPEASAVEIEGCAIESVYMSRRPIPAPVEEKGCIQGLYRKPRKSGFHRHPGSSSGNIPKDRPRIYVPMHV